MTPSDTDIDAEAAAEAAPAARALHILSALSVLLPIAFLAVGAWLSYQSLASDARARIYATVDLVHEHALRVFDTFSLVTAQTNDLLRDLSDEDIHRDEARLHAQLARLKSTLPQIQDIWVMGADGSPLVTANTYPAPRGISAADRLYFSVQKDRDVGEYVSEILSGRFRGAMFFQISTRRPSPTGQFIGVTAVSAQPDYFRNFYAQAVAGAVSTVTMTRLDGAILARFPSLPAGTARIPPDSPFFGAIARQPERGLYRATSAFDGARRLNAYRKLAEHPVYVTAGVEEGAILWPWLTSLVLPAMLAVPAAIALFWLSRRALAHARSESLALARLRAEAVRREAAEEALRQSHKMEAIGRLTGGVAHDFNNMLQVVVGRLARIRREVDRGRAPPTRDLDAMQFAADRAARLTHRLLAFSRQQPLETRVVRVDDLVAGMVDLIRQTVGESVTAETIAAKDLWPVAVDPGQFENALLNLAANARDAMPAGGRLTIRLENIPRDADPRADLPAVDLVRIAVADTGTGMSPDVIGRAFEPFYTTKPPGLGTGLGLSMVYGFARQSGGDVAIDSTPGRGTKIIIWLPRAAEEDAKSVTWRTAAAMPAATRGRGEIILVTEDEDEVRRLAVETLSEYGYGVLEAADGRAALALVEARDDITLLLTDVGLPHGMSGQQLAAAARRLRPGIRVLYITGYAQGGLAPEPGDRLEVMTKPFAPDALVRRVHHLLDS